MEAYFFLTSQQWSDILGANFNLRKYKGNSIVYKSRGQIGNFKNTWVIM